VDLAVVKLHPAVQRQDASAPFVFVLHCVVLCCVAFRCIVLH
jgi:hypothetical protein